ncbi:type I glyceraldehyde-3-phosphate dehydrogenase [Candidatus Micrarchaeota archaeon]|nr:type I glyceraldehyde-3-phosphate dehydrogenase [Candidatus Micrarchaeota archaeon]
MSKCLVINLKVAISGFGRIGKSFLRAVIGQGALGKEIEIVAINTRSPATGHVHLFKYDSVYGVFDGKVEEKNGNFMVNGYEIKWINETDPLKLPWKDLEVDLVLESSGNFKSRADCEKHLKAGAKHVLVSAPGSGVDLTVVPGVNDHLISKEMTVFSLASCTTNGLAPILKVIDSKFGIESGLMTTVHAYTNDQNIVDGSHSDLRRARAAATNIIPTSTGAAKAIGEVVTNLAGKMDGMALRVPVPDGSINDITLIVKSEGVDAKAINSELKRASFEELKGILGYTEDEIVSSDIIGSTYSSVVDAKLTKVQGKLVKVCAWYDNEFGYSNRLVDFVKKLGKM